MLETEKIDRMRLWKREAESLKLRFGKGEGRIKYFHHQVIKHKLKHASRQKKEGGKRREKKRGLMEKMGKMKREGETHVLFCFVCFVFLCFFLNSILSFYHNLIWCFFYSRLFWMVLRIIPILETPLSNLHHDRGFTYLSSMPEKWKSPNHIISISIGDTSATLFAFVSLSVSFQIVNCL